MTLQQEIIQALGAKPQINAEEEIRRSTYHPPLSTPTKISIAPLST